MSNAGLAAPGSVESASRPQNRFYRPELDVLRFLSFLGVLITHGPRPPGPARHAVFVGGFGLSMFFLLSAYLITELLLKEDDQTGDISWKLFFIRRALRIWPLYFGALAIAAALSIVPPHPFPMGRTGIVALALFVANWIPNNRLGLLLFPMWSVSIEEQFYLIWPPVIKFGRRRAALAASLFFIAFAAVWILIFRQKGYFLWTDTPVQLLFFAAGALIAVARHGKPPRSMPGISRWGLVFAGLALLTIVSLYGGLTERRTAYTVAGLYAAYGASVAGCVMLFLAAAGISSVPKFIAYLGKISYGLYVFHVGALHLAKFLVDPLNLHQTAYFIGVDSATLAVSVLVAHFSYQYFEKPFLRLKERFEVIQSRPA